MTTRATPIPKRKKWIFRSTSFGCPSREVPHICSGRGVDRSMGFCRFGSVNILQHYVQKHQSPDLSLGLICALPAPDPTMPSKAFSFAALGLPGLFSARDVCRQQGPRVQQDVPPLQSARSTLSMMPCSICFFSRLNSRHILVHIFSG